MPYKSDKQRRWAHTKDAEKKGFPTEEFDREERKKKLLHEACRKAIRGTK